MSEEDLNKLFAKAFREAHRNDRQDVKAMLLEHSTNTAEMEALVRTAEYIARAMKK